MIKMEIRKQISNHPTIKDLEREVVVYRIADNMDVKQITISARIEHFDVADDGTRTLLPEFTREVKDWIISNDYSIKKRDANNRPILDEEGNEIKELAFDSFQAMLMQFLEPLLQQGIANDDEEINRFDK